MKQIAIGQVRMIMVVQVEVEVDSANSVHYVREELIDKARQEHGNYDRIEVEHVTRREVAT